MPLRSFFPYVIIADSFHFPYYKNVVISKLITLSISLISLYHPFIQILRTFAAWDTVLRSLKLLGFYTRKDPTCI